VNAWQNEITELHDYFAAYLGGDIAEGNITPMTGALADEFSIVDPGGSIADKASVVAAIQGQHGKHPGLKMWITDFALLAESTEHVVARYIEHQDTPGGGNKRLSTVVFARNDERPNGLQWLTIHETWLP